MFSYTRYSGIGWLIQLYNLKYNFIQQIKNWIKKIINTLNVMKIIEELEKIEVW